MSSDSGKKTKRIGRWYFGGLASAAAACCTHPLDLLKVHLQTAGTSEKIGIIRQTGSIIRQQVRLLHCHRVIQMGQILQISLQGILALYNGLSASLVRQLTYSTTRFAMYEMAKQQVSPNGEPISFPMRVSMAALAGACGGFVGTPGDMVNVRMQNDVKLPPEQRRK